MQVTVPGEISPFGVGLGAVQEVVLAYWLLLETIAAHHVLPLEADGRLAVRTKVLRHRAAHFSADDGPEMIQFSACSGFPSTQPFGTPLSVEMDSLYALTAREVGPLVFEEGGLRASVVRGDREATLVREATCPGDSHRQQADRDDQHLELLVSDALDEKGWPNLATMTDFRMTEIGVIFRQRSVLIMESQLY